MGGAAGGARAACTASGKGAGATSRTLSARSASFSIARPLCVARIAWTDVGRRWSHSSRRSLSSTCAMPARWRRWRRNWLGFLSAISSPLSSWRTRCCSDAERRRMSSVLRNLNDAAVKRMEHALAANRPQKGWIMHGVEKVIKNMEELAWILDEDVRDWWPWVPVEELVDARSEPLVVCFDLEATGLNPGSRIVQLAAYCPRHSGIACVRQESFNTFVLPDDVDAMEETAGEKTGLRLGCTSDGTRALLDDRNGGRALPAESEASALAAFIEWLRSQMPPTAGGVVLVSHGAVLLDVPLLLNAAHRHGMEDEFYEVVVGWCDSMAVFEAERRLRLQGRVRYRDCGRVGIPAGGADDLWFKGGLALNALYKHIVAAAAAKEKKNGGNGGGGGGESNGGEDHRADVDAIRLHELLCKYFNVSELTLSGLPPLARFCFSARCVRQLALWRHRWSDVHWAPLWDLIAVPQCQSRPGGAHSWMPVSSPQSFGRMQRTLVRNILSAGLNASSLEELWAHGGRGALTERLRRMKGERESYLSDSAYMSLAEVIARVQFALEGQMLPQDVVGPRMYGVPRRVPVPQREAQPNPRRKKKTYSKKAVPETGERQHSFRKQQ